MSSDESFAQSLISLNETICMSGGAIGADLQWGMNAGKTGHFVIHWSFENHKTYAPKEEVVILTKDLLEETDQFLEVANKSLKRRIPKGKLWILNLLRRNFYQIKWSDAVYAVSSLDKNNQVEGGTAWAVQMYIDRCKIENIQPKLFLFDQKKNQWYKWEENWINIDSPPKPEKIYAGIGSRDLNDFGKNAIRNLYINCS